MQQQASKQANKQTNKQTNKQKTKLVMTFTVLTVVEFGLSCDEEWEEELAQRVLLRRLDCFHIPPGNIYRLFISNTIIIFPLHKSFSHQARILF
jgi:ABC-type hemin transport system ATPase subunit